MNATVFGAGNIGRGLIGLVLDQLGYHLTFVDADAELVESLQQAGSYTVTLGDGEQQSVAGAAYVNARDVDAVVASVAKSDLIATAVGEPILKIVADPIGRGLLQSEIENVNVLACENVHPNSPALQAHIREIVGDEAADRAGFPEVIVDRIVSTEPGSLELSTEAAFEFIAERANWRGAEPAGGIVLVDQVEAYEKRKLWLVNGLHAAVAFLGLKSGHTYAHEAMADEEIRGTARRIADSMVQVLETDYSSFPAGEFASTADSSLDRFAAADMPDPLNRIARNPLPKLAPTERVVGPAIAAARLGLPLGDFAKVIAAMLTVNDMTVAGAEELQNKIAAEGWESVLTGAPSALITEIREQIDQPGEAQMVTKEVTIVNPAGIHARPAALIIEKAKGSGAKIQIIKGEKTANAASMMSVLALGGKTGDTVTITGEGENAEETVAFIVDLLTSEEAI